MKLSPLYVAGFFDGEGCVAISKDRGTRHNKRPSYTLTVTVANQHLGVLESLKESFGGRGWVSMHQKGTNQPVYYWSCSAQLAVQFLEWIRPYSWVKAEQIWIGLEFMAQRGLGGGRGRSLTDEAIALREGFFLAIRNAKGRKELL